MKEQGGGGGVEPRRGTEPPSFYDKRRGGGGGGLRWTYRVRMMTFPGGTGTVEIAITTVATHASGGTAAAFPPSL